MNLITSMDNTRLIEFKNANLPPPPRPLIPPPELPPDFELIDDNYVNKISSYIDDGCRRDFMQIHSNKEYDDSKPASLCNDPETNQVLKNAMTILIPFLKYKSMTNSVVKTGGKKHKSATRKMRCRRSYRKKRKLLV